MAIMKTVTIPKGVNVAKAEKGFDAAVLILENEYELKNAYIFIERTENAKGDVLATIGYKSDRNSPVIYEEIISFIVDISDDAMNEYRQKYVLMKDMDKFNGAVDVLEEGQTALYTYVSLSTL